MERSRHHRWRLVTLLVIGIPLAYLAALGPWVYLHDDLPPWPQRLVEWMYFPVEWLYEETDFRDSTIGKFYMRYIEWWADWRRI